MEIAEAVLYNDDSLCVRYQDGSFLQLTPCASSFRFYESRSSSSYFQRPYFQQITRFTISSLRGKVASAVKWRNQYACRPYLCKELIEKELINVGHDNASECSWPQALSPECIIVNNNNSVTVKSLNGHAKLTLNPHRQTYTACYLAQISHDTKQLSTQWLYTWLHTAEQSIHSCPECWKYPLQIALAKSNERELVESQEVLKLCNISKLPSSLPLNCPAAHLHKWFAREQVFSGNEQDGLFWQPNIKVILKDNITYRVYQNKEHMLKVEIHPGNNTVFSSDGLSGKFFKHYTTANTTEEKMYTSDKPPPNKPNMNYSTAKILRLASRLFHFVLSVGIHCYNTTSSVCWHLKPSANTDDLSLQNNAAPHILETAQIPGVGKFVAYSNGHLFISFVDRTLLNVKYRPTVRRDELWFNFTLRNGQVVQGNLDNMQGLERYIKMAIEWGEWINTSPQQREAFYTDTLWNPENQRIVEAEVGKLQRFNYILEHGTLNQRLTDAAVTIHSQYEDGQERGVPKQEEDLSCTHTSSVHITTALQQTSNAIKNIESFLMNSKCI